MGNKSLGFVCKYSQEFEELYDENSKPFEKKVSKILTSQQIIKDYQEKINKIADMAIKQGVEFFKNWAREVQQDCLEYDWPLKFFSTSKSNNGWNYMILKMNPKGTLKKGAQQIEFGIEVVDDYKNSNGYAFIQWIRKSGPKSSKEELATYINEKFKSNNHAKNMGWSKEGIISYLSLNNGYISKSYDIDLQKISNKLKVDRSKITYRDWEKILNFK